MNTDLMPSFAHPGLALVNAWQEQWVAIWMLGFISGSIAATVALSALAGVREAP